jgi:hypothetical protein
MFHICKPFCFRILQSHLLITNRKGMKFSVKKFAKRFGVAAFLFFFIKGLVWLAVFFGLAKLFFPDRTQKTAGELSVWHAYATDTSNQLLHFKMIVPEVVQDTAAIIEYGRHFLREQRGAGHALSVKHCPSCTVEQDKTLKKTIKEKGYAVYD